MFSIKPWILLASFSTFMLVEEIVSTNDPELYRDGYRMPLTLMKIHNSSNIQLAIPQEYRKNDEYIGYYYDIPEDENGPTRELVIACPPYFREQIKIERNLIRADVMSHHDELLFISKPAERTTARCYSSPNPSIKIVRHENNEGKTEYCGPSQAEIYQVGYWVSNIESGEEEKKETDIQFVSMYEMCYSKIKDGGLTLYSIHRIVSPSLLLHNQIRELPRLNPLKKYYKSILDINFNTMESFRHKEYYSYQFVGIDDMPLSLWGKTTAFLFNYTTITKNADIFKGMIRADYYIRLYSKKNNKPLTLYSGTHQQLIQSNVPCISIFCEPTPTLIDSFWRIIVDDDGLAIILVTQHTLKKCDDRAYLCEKNRKEKKYKNGGCIYTCSLKEDDRLFEVLGLPQFTINGDLDFTFKTGETMTIPEEIRQSSGKKTSKSTDIIDFLSNASFMGAMENVDANIASKVVFLSASDDYYAGGSWWF